MMSCSRLLLNYSFQEFPLFSPLRAGCIIYAFSAKLCHGVLLALPPFHEGNRQKKTVLYRCYAVVVDEIQVIYKEFWVCVSPSNICL